MYRLLVAMSILGLAVSPSTAREDEPQKRLLTIQGQGKAHAVPDIAVLGVEVGRDGEDLDPVLSRVRAEMAEVMEALRSLGIAEKDIRTEVFRVQPKYERDKRQNPRPVGHTVTHRVSVKVRDLARTGKALAAALKAGASTVEGPNFEIDNRNAVEKEALAAATRDALEKAQAVAAAAGVKLGEIASIHPQPMAWPMPRMARALLKAVDAAGVAEPIAAGEQTVTADVTLAFEID